MEIGDFTVFIVAEIEIVTYNFTVFIKMIYSERGTHGAV